MTDPVQTQDPTQQTQGDDVFSWIFWWNEEIFDTSDILQPIEEEKKTQVSVPEEVFTFPEEEISLTEEPEQDFDPIVEEAVEPQIVEEEPVKEEISPNVVEEEPVEEEIIEPIVEEETPIEIQHPEWASDLIISFYDLFALVKTYEWLTEGSEHKELLWWNTDTVKLIYELQSDEESVTAYRKEINKENGEETLHTMTLSLNDTKDSLQISLDEVALYDEKQDLIDNPNRKMQVAEKINKFIFLLEEEIKNLEKKQRELEENKEQKKILQNVFRNF